MRMMLWALRLLFWLFLFFTLFAFALNNEQTVVVRWFFDAQWKAPLVIVVLAAFTFGAGLGVLAMAPSWWRHRRVARRHAPPVVVVPNRPAVTAPTLAPNEFAPEHPPREGL